MFEDFTGHCEHLYGSLHTLFMWRNSSMRLSGVWRTAFYGEGNVI